MKGRTKIDGAVRNAIKEYIIEHGYSPSYTDLAAILGYSTADMVRKSVQGMLERGELESDHLGTPRTLRVPELTITEAKKEESNLERALQRFGL